MSIAPHEVTRKSTIPAQLASESLGQLAASGRISTAASAPNVASADPPSRNSHSEVHRVATAGGAERNPGSRQGRGLHGQLVHQLGQMIVTGNFDTLRPLVPEEIGRRFDVSRTVVRESLRVLEAKGLVSARPNVGTRVRPVTEWNLFDPDVMEWRFSGPGRHEHLQELLELWSAIEPTAARLLAARGDRGVLANLAAAVPALSRAAEDNDTASFTEIDVQFHTAILTAGGNHMLAYLAPSLTPVLQACGRRLASCPEEYAALIGLHQRLVDALDTGAEDATEQASRSVLSAVQPSASA